MRVLELVAVVVTANVCCLLAIPLLPSSEDEHYGGEESLDWEWWTSSLQDIDEMELKFIGNDIRDAIIQILDDIRQDMVTGFPELGIPVLDPLSIPFLPFNVTWDANNVLGNLSDSELVNLATFQTAKVLVNMLGMSVDIGLLLDNLLLHGYYFMDGHALDFDVFGDGNYHIQLNGLTFSFYMKLKLGKYLSVKDMTADFTLKDSVVQFEHLMNGGIVGGLINEALSVELPRVLGVVESSVLPPLLDLLVNRTNDYLHQFPIIPDFNITLWS